MQPPPQIGVTYSPQAPLAAGEGPRGGKPGGCGVLVGLDDHPGEHTELLAVGRYSRMGCISTWVVEREVLCQGSSFPCIFPTARPPCPVPSTPKPHPFPSHSSPALLSVGNVRMRMAEAESWALVWSVAWWGHVSAS